MSNTKEPKRPWALMQSIGGRFRDGTLGGKIGLIVLVLAGVIFTFPAGLIVLALVVGLDALGMVPVGALRFMLGGALLTGAEGIAQQGNPKAVTVAEGLSPVTRFENDPEEYETLPWLGAVSGLFGEHFTQSIPNGGGIRIVLKKQDARDAYAVGRMWMAYTDSVRFERYKRGYPLTDAAGEMVTPESVAQGLIIEKEENDDGSVTALVAVGVVGCRSSNDYAEGEKLDLCGKFIEWRAQGYATSRFTTRGKELLDRSMARDWFCKPLLSLKIERVTLREAVSNANPFAPVATVHGDAAFAWWGDLEASRATCSFWGEEGKRDWSGAILGEFIPSRFFPGQSGKAVVQATGEGHSLTVGAPGTGKFTAAIAPLLLTADKASAVVFDVKNGEAAKKTGRHRATLGRVLVLDPFGVSGQPSGALNPLDGLRETDPMFVEKVRRVVDAIYVEAAASGGENSFWDSSAKALLSAFIVHAVTSPDEEGQRTLKRVREMIQTPLTAKDNPRSDALLSAMARNMAAGGMVRDEAENILAGIDGGADKTLYSIQQTLKAQTDFLGLPMVQKVTSETTFNPATLRQEVATLYVVVPESELKTVSRWLRLIYAAIMGAVRSEGVPLHVIMDEFPALGSFPRVVEDMARVRSLGIRMHVVVQSLAQLQQIYGRGWETFTANAKYLRVLGANDDMTQKHVSGRLGRTTVRVRGETTNRNNTGGGSAGSSFNLTGVPLMTPDQVGRMSPDELLVIVEGEKPLRLSKMHGFNDPTLKVLGDFNA